MIQVKDLQVFEDNKTKSFTDFLDYKDTPTFQSFLLVDNNNTRNFENVNMCHIKAFTLIF